MAASGVPAGHSASVVLGDRHLNERPDRRRAIRRRVGRAHAVVGVELARAGGREQPPMLDRGEVVVVEAALTDRIERIRQQLGAHPARRHDIERRIEPLVLIVVAVLEDVCDEAPTMAAWNCALRIAPELRRAASSAPGRSSSRGQSWSRP